MKRAETLARHGAAGTRPPAPAGKTFRGE
jgi:hypothetical protein